MTGQRVSPLGSVISVTTLIRRENYNPDLSECHQRDFIQNIESPDLPPHVPKIYQGDPCILLRNISTMSGLVKGWRYWTSEIMECVMLITLDNQEELTLSRIPIEKF
jgi:hypothetical protein